MRMPKGLEMQDSFDKLNFIKSNSSESIKNMIKELPIEDLVFDDILCELELNSWAVFIVLELTSVFSTYNWQKEKHPDLNLPNLPADEFTKLLITRLIDALRKNHESGKEITPAIEKELENVANNLNAGGYNHESIEIYRICKSQRYISFGRKESMEFGIFFNLYRIAFNSKNPDDCKIALDATKNFTEPGCDMEIYQSIIKGLKENFIDR